MQTLEILRQFGPTPFKAHESAETNLDGRTHFYDAGTRRFFGSKCLESHVVDNGLTLATVESSWADPDRSRRVFRPAVFDVWGTVIYRPDLESAFRSKAAAVRDMWRFVNGFDADKHARAELHRRAVRAIKESAEILSHVGEA